MSPPPPAREGIWISGQLCGLRTLDSGAGETQSPQTCSMLHTAKTPGIPLLWFQSGSRCTCAYTKKDFPLISLKILSWRGWGGHIVADVSSLHTGTGNQAWVIRLGPLS